MPSATTDVDAAAAFLGSATRLGFSITHVTQAVGVDISHIYRAAKGGAGFSSTAIIVIRMAVSAIESCESDGLLPIRGQNKKNTRRLATKIVMERLKERGVVV